MQVTYRGNVDLDVQVRDAEASRPGKALKIRVAPTLLIGDQHKAWTGVSWSVDCTNGDEVIAMRRALEAFFDAVADYGAAGVEKALTRPVSAQ